MQKHNELENAAKETIQIESQRLRKLNKSITQQSGKVQISWKLKTYKLKQYNKPEAQSI